MNFTFIKETFYWLLDAFEKHSGIFSQSELSAVSVMVFLLLLCSSPEHPSFPSFIPPSSSVLSWLQQPGGGRVSAGARSRRQRAGQRRAHPVTQRCLLRGETRACARARVFPSFSVSVFLTSAAASPPLPDAQRRFSSLNLNTLVVTVTFSVSWNRSAD